MCDERNASVAAAADAKQLPVVNEPIARAGPCPGEGIVRELNKEGREMVVCIVARDSRPRRLAGQRPIPVTTR